MSCCFAPDIATVQAQAPDPSLHVNYVRGLVLDVDDFTQEFAYHAGRDQWLVRDEIGYGTLRGLQVGVADTGAQPDDPARWKVTVSGGSAADPCGRLVCVPRDQCGYVNAWLAQNGDIVTAKLAGGQRLELHLVLSYADCLTQDVPIPGEPCRSEDALKAPSRIADDFLVDFSLDAPLQAEEDELRHFAQWLRAIPMAADVSTHTRVEFAALVAQWQAGDVQPPADLALAAADVADYLRDALRVWATALRPLVYGRACGCASVSTDHEERVLLATLEIDVEQPDGKPWRVKALAGVDESRRPVLVHARLLTECLARAGAAAVALAPAQMQAMRPAAAQVHAVRLVASGKVAGDGSADGPVVGGLRVVKVGAHTVTIGFDGYRPPSGQHQYIVKVLPVSTARDSAPVVHFLAYAPAGVVLQVNPGARAGTAKAAMEEHEFVLEINQIGHAA